MYSLFCCSGFVDIMFGFVMNMCDMVFIFGGMFLMGFEEFYFDEWFVYECVVELFYIDCY